MILIKEDTPKKISGKTSFFIYFDYNEAIINVLKNSDVYSYDKKTRAWEAPLTSLSFLLDNLTCLDDIKLIIQKDEGTLLEQRETSLNYITKPFPYQLEGIKYGLNHDKWLLLDAPGLGKTLQIIYLAEELKAQRGLKHCLIICGVNTLKTNWKKEIHKHSAESCIILGEKTNSKGIVTYASISERAKQLKNSIDAFFIITNIETFRSDAVVDALSKATDSIDMIAVDEIHRCKDMHSQQGRNLLRLNSKYKVAATGTLLLNNPLDAYVPLRWTNNERAPLYTFKSQYCEFGGFGGKQVVGFKNTNLLKDEIEACSLRRTKDLLSLPTKSIINEYVDLSDEHRDFYDAIEQGVKTEADKVDLNTDSLLALVTRLRQASVLPEILTTNKIKSSKLERCLDLVEQLISQHEKVVIMSTFKSPVYYLADMLSKYKPLVCTGDNKDSSISEAIDSFQNDPTRMIMIATWQKMGTGITLTAASYMIFLDTPWTYSLFEQACDRIYRIGQSKPVIIYDLIATHTIDERVKDLLSTKKAMSDFIVDNNTSADVLNSLKRYIQDL